MLIKTQNYFRSKVISFDVANIYIILIEKTFFEEMLICIIKKIKFRLLTISNLKTTITL
jgi:hypothetical protein